MSTVVNQMLTRKRERHHHPLPHQLKNEDNNSTTNYDNGIMQIRIQEATEGLTQECFNYLYHRILPTNQENAITVVNYIASFFVRHVGRHERTFKQARASEAVQLLLW
jgi:hypothetical protein